MNDQLLQAQILSARKPFTIVCPNCNESKTFKLTDLPPDFSNPFKYNCPCGATWHIALDYRKSHRKSINLAGSFAVLLAAKKIQWFFDTLDLSVTGMEIVTDYAHAILKGQFLDVTVILHDKQRTKLNLTCVVRRMTRSANRLILGLEFINLGPAQQQALASFVIALSGLSEAKDLDNTGPVTDHSRRPQDCSLQATEGFLSALPA